MPGYWRLQSQHGFQPLSFCGLHCRAQNKIETAEYATLLSAFTAADNGATILSRGISFSEVLIFSTGKNVLLKGGYNAMFSENAGNHTRVRGSLKIRSGRLTVNNVRVY